MLSPVSFWLVFPGASQESQQSSWASFPGLDPGGAFPVNLTRLRSCGHVCNLTQGESVVPPKGKSGSSAQKGRGIAVGQAQTADLPGKAMNSEGLALSQLVPRRLSLLGLSVHL